MNVKSKLSHRALSPNRRVMSLELLLVVILPVVAVVACAITLMLALQSPAHESVLVDRFGHLIQTGH